MKTATDYLNAVQTDVISKRVGVPPDVVRKWRRRKRVPCEYWLALHEASQDSPCPLSLVGLAVEAASRLTKENG